MTTLNVIQLGIAFFFLFFAFNASVGIIEIVLDSYAARGILNRHAGYRRYISIQSIERIVACSLAIIYAVFAVANVFGAPIVHRLGSRYSMTLGATAYVVFHAGFYFVNEPYLYSASALVGLGAAGERKMLKEQLYVRSSALWTAEGNYLARCSDETTASLHSGIFWAILQSWYALIVLMILCRP